MRECATGLAANRGKHNHSVQKTITMHTLLVLIATALACALARPPAATDAPQAAPLGPKRQRVPLPTSPEFLSSYALPRYLMPHDIGYDDSPRVPRPPQDLLDQEINMINQMDMQNLEPIPYDQFQRFLPDLPPNYMKQMLSNPIEGVRLMDPGTSTDELAASPLRLVDDKSLSESDDSDMDDTNYEDLNIIDYRRVFALTPRDPGYYEKTTTSPKTTTIEADEHRQQYDVMEPRQARQNPNWSKFKNLVSADLEELRTGFTHDAAAGTDRPLHHTLEAPTGDAVQPIFAVALLAAIGAAITMAIIGFAFGWYTLSKKAKAAADVDYPAYGVTGPTVDHSGDRKLAQSAHMFHYQHQKQQIIAMERSGLDDGNGSVSDPDSEEDNEEGDYTVYECPGFATTGEMEVKNPLFKDDVTPASAKCDAAKSQPRE